MKRAISFIIGLIFISSVSAQCEDAIVPSTPDVRYQDNGDGTVTDLYNGLVWKRCTESRDGSDCSLGAVTIITYTWQEALNLVDVLNASGGYAGHIDWRLPNIKELASLIEVQCASPAINEALFPATQPSSYWSGSPHSHWTEQSWVVFFNTGWVSFTTRNRSAYVRLVRGG